MCYGDIILFDIRRHSMNLHIVPSGKDDKILYFAISIRKGKKTTSKNIEKIGKLSELRKIYDDPIAHFREEAKRRTEEGKTPVSFEVAANEMLDTKQVRKISFGYIFPQSIYYSLGLDDIMRKIRTESKINYDFNRIMRDLIIGRILDPLSKQSTFLKAKSFPEVPDYELHHIYRALSTAAKNFDMIEEKTFKGLANYIDVDTSVTYYDCTNFFFEIEEQDELRTYGKSKENRPNPIVQMGMFLDRNGLPISMCINPGNTNEQLTMIPLEEKMQKRFGIKKFVVCADCGLSSQKNLKYNSTAEHGFIVTKSLKKTKKEIRERLMKEDGWKRFGDRSGTTYTLTEIQKTESLHDATFYHDEWFVGEKSGTNERIITTYRERLRQYQRSIRESQINRAMKLVDSGKLKKGVNQNDIRRFILEENFTKDGEEADKRVFSINQDLVDEESLYDGFYAVTTDLSDDANEIVRINRERWEIEESFRIMKTEFDARPVYLSREDRIRSHFLTCFLALMVYRVMERKMIQSGEQFTTREIISSLRNYEIVDMGSFYIGAMEGKAIKALEKTFGLVGSMKAFSKATFRKLISRSKKEM